MKRGTRAEKWHSSEALDRPPNKTIPPDTSENVTRVIVVGRNLRMSAQNLHRASWILHIGDAILTHSRQRIRNYKKAGQNESPSIDVRSHRRVMH